MTASRSGKLLDLLARRLHEPLKARGFSRTGRRWTRPRGTLMHVVELQASRWNTPEGGDFTLNLGVFVPSVHALGWGEPNPRIRAVDCQVRARLGALMPDGVLAVAGPKGQNVDFWWRFRADSDIDALGQAVADPLLSYGIPFLDRFDSLHSVRDFLLARSDQPPFDPWWRINAAILQAQLGAPEAACRLLQEAFEEKVTRHEMSSPHIAEAWRGRIGGVAGRLGLHLHTQAVSEAGRDAP